MTSRLLNDVFPEFASLIERRNFKILSERYDQKCFGNTIIEAASPELRLRLIRQRSEILVDVSAPTSVEWHYLVYVLEFLDSTQRNDWLTLPDPGWLALQLEEKYLALTSFVTDQASATKFQVFLEGKWHQRRWKGPAN